MKRIAFIVALVTLTPGVFALTQTVNSGGGADQTTINAALTAVLAASDGPDVVNITGGGPYDEAIAVVGTGIDLTIQGTDPLNRPIIALRNNTAPPAPALSGDGLTVYADGSVTIRNLVLIPSLAPNTPADDFAMHSPNTAGGTLNLLYDNVLCSANDGSNNPLNDDPFVVADTSGATRVPDDGLYIDTGFVSPNPGTINATIRNTSVIQANNVGGAGDCIILTDDTTTPNQNSYIIGPNVKLSGGRYGIQTANDMLLVDINGEPGAPFISANQAVYGLLLFNGTTVNVDNALVVDNPNGIRVDPDTVGTFTMTNSIVANTGSEAVSMFFDPAVPKTWTIDNCTFHNNGATATPTASQIQVASVVSSNLTVDISNSIFTSAANQAPALGLDGAATVNVTNCGLVTAGPYALPGITAGAGTPPVITGTVNADPDYVSVLGDGTPDQFDVSNTADYAGAGTAGSDLAGGADLVYTVDATPLTITVDGDPSDWTGAAGADGTLIFDAATNQLIYNDPTGDDLGDGDYTPPTDAAFNDTESDLEEVRIAHDGTNLFVLVRTGAYGTGFGTDFETAMTQVAINTSDTNGPQANDFGGFSDTRLATGLEWEALFGLGETGSGVNAFRDGDFGNTFTVAGAQDEANAAVEFSVALADIGNPGNREINVVVGQGHSEGGAFRQVVGGAAQQFQGGNGDPVSVLNGLISRVYDLASPGVAQSDQEDEVQNAVIGGSEIPLILTGLSLTGVRDFELYR